MTSLSDLDRLHAEATPGPWRSDWRGTNHFEITSDAADGSYWVVSPAHNCCDQDLPRWDAAGHDLDFIAAIRNAYPALRAYVAALEAERDASREVMRHQDRLLWLCEENTGEDIEAVRVTRLATDAARAQMEKQDG